MLTYTYVALLSFAHRARCVAAIFLLAAALIVRFFPDAAPLDDDPSTSLRSSLFRSLSFSLISAARRSCWGVRSVMFMMLQYNS